FPWRTPPRRPLGRCRGTAAHYCGSMFVFPAEDGIRDFHVTGVQTCALPIYPDLDISVIYVSNNSSISIDAVHKFFLETLYGPERDRKSTRLNSSHVKISYAVFCLKKKKNKKDS